MTGTKVTAETIRAMKGRGEKIAALTAYDCPMTRLLDEAGVPLILVGDSLGMVVLGYPDTTHVTMAEMEHHVRAAARAKPRALLAADLPYHSYETVADAVANAKRLAAAGAEAVKAEGGAEILEQVRAIIEHDVALTEVRRNRGIEITRHAAPLCIREEAMAGPVTNGKGFGQFVQECALTMSVWAYDGRTIIESFKTRE